MNKNDWIAKSLSTPRLGPYLERVDGDQRAAIDLYMWNVELAGALHEVLSVVEVVIRNAFDAELRKWNTTMSRPQGPYPSEWALDPAPVVRRTLKDPLQRATRNAEKASKKRSNGHPRKGATVTHDDVVAQLSFGCWAVLMPSSQPDNMKKKRLWDSALVEAFPFAAAPRISKVMEVTGEELAYSRLARLVQLRNRVAHCEPLLDVNVRARLRDAYVLMGYVNPAMRDLMSGTNRVQHVMSKKPRP